MEEQNVGLYVAAPVASFRAPHAREYLETLPCPPPSTVFGMLLSLVGEENRLVHAGAEIALALLSVPARSTVIRTSWRLKTADAPGVGSNKRPDFQEVLTDVRIAVWVRPGGDAAARSLAERVRSVVDRDEVPNRYGGLALGESTHLVDELRRLRTEDLDGARILRQDVSGDLALPVWVDHVGSRGTRWGQYRLAHLGSSRSLPDNAWSRLEPLANQ